MTEYTAAQRKEALKLYVEHGPAEAARQCDIPSGTIRSWAHKDGLARLRYEKTEAATNAAVERATLKREELRELLLDQAIDLIHRMNAPHKDFKGSAALEVWWAEAPSGSTRDYATAAAILIDKYRLEMGEHTDRQVIVSPLDVELERLLVEDARQAQAKT